MRLLSCVMILLPSLAAAGDAPKPVRIGSGVSGHIHPSACISKKGTIVVIYSQSDYKDQRVSRSTDAGLTWTTPEPFEPNAKLSIYPGSLTALKDGRIVHMWNTWYPAGKDKSRFVQYCISSDEGKTWGETLSLDKGGVPSIIRHPFIELSANAWLLSLADRTEIYDPVRKTSTQMAQKHGLVPIVQTPKGTLVAGDGQRSTDMGKTWEKIKPFPNIAPQGWRHEMMVHSNGWLFASDIEGPGVGGDRIRFIVSKDDGKTWDFKNALTYYDPNRPIGGRACPRTIELDAKTLGTIFYDTDAKQPGGSGIFFLRTPLASFK